MIINFRFGKLRVVEGTEEAEALAGMGQAFALFGRQQINHLDAIRDGVDLFAARVAAFDAAMQSCYKHLLLKQDLVEHINSLN